MILSNREICAGIKAKKFNIEGLAGTDPTQPPFNTSAVDLRLSGQISIPQSGPAAFDLRRGGIIPYLTTHSTVITATKDQPYTLKPHDFVLGMTMETVDFTINERSKAKISYSARVEGKSSLARCGILVHFTAPTIHAGFRGKIALEIINLGPMHFLLYPDMYFCQLIIEEVKGMPAPAPNQFKNQTTPTGKK